MFINMKLTMLFLVVLAASFVLAEPSRRLNPTRPKAFDYAADAEQVVGQLHHNFSCDGREYGYYADQGQECKVFHICMPVKTVTGRILDTFQFSFFCPSQTRFSQDSRTCISQEQAYPCQKAHTLYDLNKAIGHRPKKKKRPVNPKDAVLGFKPNTQGTLSKSSESGVSIGNAALTPVPKKSFDHDSFSTGSFEESSGGFAVQEGVTPVHTDSTLKIGAPAVAIPPSAGNTGSVTNFAGRPRSSAPVANPSANVDIPSNDISQDVNTPDFIIPPGSQIISTKSIQHQNVLLEPIENNKDLLNRDHKGSITKSPSISISTHGSSGLSNSNSFTQAPVTTPFSSTSFRTVSSTTPIINSIESTTPHSSFSNNDNHFNSVRVNNRGGSFTSTESPASFRPIPQTNDPLSNSAARSRHTTPAPNVIFSNSHTLEAAPVTQRGQISTFASRARAHSAQSLSQQRTAQVSQSSGQQSRSFTSNNVGNNRLITSRPTITSHEVTFSTPQPFTISGSSVPSPSQQFTPPPTISSFQGTSKPLQIPGFSAGVSHRGSGNQNVHDAFHGTQQPSTVNFRPPTTTEYFFEEENLEATFTTDTSFDFAKSGNQISSFNQSPRQPTTKSPHTLNRFTNQSPAPSSFDHSKPHGSTTFIKQSPTPPTFGHSTVRQSTTHIGQSPTPSSFGHSTVHQSTTLIGQSSTPSSFGHSTVHQSSTFNKHSPIPSSFGHSTVHPSTAHIGQTPTPPSFGHSDAQVTTSFTGNFQNTFTGITTELPVVPSSRNNNNFRERIVSTQSVRNPSPSRALRTDPTGVEKNNSPNSIGQPSQSTTINRGGTRRRPSHTQIPQDEKPARPVTRNRGSKKFQPSAYLLQSIGFQDAILRRPQTQKNTQARSHSRSRNGDSLTSNHVQSISKNIQSSTSNAQDLNVNVSFENTKISSSQNTFDNEASKQGLRSETQTNSRNEFNQGRAESSVPTPHVSTTPTTARPSVNTRITSESSGRILGSGSPSTFSPSNFNTQSRQPVSTLAVTTRAPLRRQPVINRASANIGNDSPDSLKSTNETSADSDRNNSNFGARKVIKKKIIVNGRPGSRKAQESSAPVLIESQQTAESDEEQKKRQKALEALARFSPGFSNANLLSFRIVPNKPKKNTKEESLTLPLTTEASVQLTPQPPTSTPSTRRLSSRRRGSSQFRSTTTPQTLTSQLPQQRGSSRSRSTTTPLPLTPQLSQRRGNSRSRSTTTTVPLASQLSQRRENSRSRSTTTQPLLTSQLPQQRESSVSYSTTTATPITTPISRQRGFSRSPSTTTASPPVTTTQISRVRSRISSRRLSRLRTQNTVKTTVAPESTTAITPTTISPFQRIRNKARQNSATQRENSSTPSPVVTTASSSLVQTRTRGETKFKNHLNNSLRRVLKKVTPLSDNAAASLTKASTSPSSSTAPKSSSKQMIQSSQHSKESQGKSPSQLRVIGTSFETSVSSTVGQGKSAQRSSSVSSSSTRSRFNSRSRASSSATSRNTSRFSTKQQPVHKPLTDLELEALSALAQVNSAFGSAAKHRLSAKSSSSSSSSSVSSSRRQTSRSRSRSL